MSGGSWVPGAAFSVHAGGAGLLGHLTYGAAHCLWFSGPRALLPLTCHLESPYFLLLGVGVCVCVWWRHRTDLLPINEK